MARGRPETGCWVGSHEAPVPVLHRRNHRHRLFVWSCQHRPDQVQRSRRGTAGRLEPRCRGGSRSASSLALRQPVGVDVAADDERQRATHRLRSRIRDGWCEEVVELLEAGADPNGGRRRISPLASAADLGRVDVVEALVAFGANLAWTSSVGWSAASFADANEHFALAERLVALGVPAASRTAHGYTPLHRAARRGDVAEVSRLAREEVDPLDASGDTPLLLAIAERHEDAAAALLDLGANPDHIAGGWSLLGSAAYQDSVRGESTDLVGLLLGHGVNIRPEAYPPTFQAINQEGSSGRVLRRLVDAGADIAARWEPGHETVLHRIAAIVDDGDLVDVALDLGAEIDARDRNGRTPLLVAARAPNPATFVRLVDRGANVLVRDHRGQSVDELLEDDDDGVLLRRYLVDRPQ